jgi:hypothetical protein
MNFREEMDEMERRHRRFTVGLALFMLAAVVGAGWFGFRQEAKCESSGGSYSWRLDLCIPGAVK